MFAIEVFTYTDFSGHTREVTVQHLAAIDARNEPTWFTDILWSRAYFCKYCCSIWARRTVLKQARMEEFTIYIQECRKHDGSERFFDDSELEIYLPILPLELKVHEFMGLMHEHL